MSMQLNPSEISELIRQRINDFEVVSEARNEGTIVSVSDGILKIHGLADVMQGEMIELPGGKFGLALNLERDSVGAVVLGDYSEIVEGQKAKCTLLIDDALEFIARVKKAVNGEYPVDYCKVAYYSEKENHENLSVYHKQDVYDYQKEFRFCFDAKVAGPLEFNIGSIDDISQLLKAEDLPTLTLKLNGV